MALLYHTIVNPAILRYDTFSRDMSTTRALAHNTLVQFIGKAVGTALALFASTFLFRYLGPADYGKFHIILTIVQLSGIIGDLGLYLIVLNDISHPKRDHNHVVSQHFMFRLYLNALYLLIMAAIALIAPYESAIRLGIFLMSFSNMFIWLSQIFQTVFQKHLVSSRAAISEIVGRGALLLATILMMYFRAPLVPLTLTVVIGNAAQFFLSWYFARKYVAFAWRMDGAYIIEMLSRTWPVALCIWFHLLYFKADSVILSWYVSNYEVGIYGMPYRIIETLVTWPLVFMGLLLPILNDAYARGDRADFQAYMQRGFDALAVMGAPLLFGTFPLARAVVLLLGGAEFLPSASVLSILMIGVFMMFVGSIFAHTVITVSSQKAMIKYYAILAVVMISLNMALIPRYSYFAAAWLTSIGEVAMFSAAFVVVWKKTRFVPSFGVFIKAMLSAILMSAVLWLVRDASLFITLPLSLALYGGILYAIGGVKKETIREVIRLRT